MDGRRAVAVVGVTCLLGGVPFAVGPVPARIAVGHLAAAAAAAPVPTASAAPDSVQATEPAEVAPTDAGPDCLVLKCVALTFDDGPVAGTERLLGILASTGVKATFFDVGEMAAARPDMVRAEVEQGNEVGNHSWSHPQLSHLDDVGVGEQVQRTAQALAGDDGVRPTLFRPPYGEVDDRLRAVLADQGDAVILWSVDTVDWRYRSPDAVYQRAVDGVRPGSIVLMHDIRPTTVDAVPRIIAELDRRGYTFVTVNELFGGKLEPGRVYTGREQEWQTHQAAVATEPSDPDSGPPAPRPTP